MTDGTHTFSVEAQLGSGAASSPATYSWRVDTTPPTINLIFPNVLGIYNATNWGAGCAPIGICGTASDPSGVTNVSVAILQWATDDYWNGHSFSSASQVFNSATGTTSWNYPFALPIGGVYTVFVQATDGLGNKSQGAGLIESTFLVSSGKAAAIAESSGSPQSATVHSAFGSPLVAKVTDSGGSPVTGTSVTFTAPASGASGTFASCSGGNPTAYECVVTTDSNGLATSSAFTANTVAGGPYTVSASTSGVSGTANFSLTNNPQTASQLAFTTAPVSGAASSSATLGPITVQLEDTYGNVVNAGSNTNVNLSSNSAGGIFASTSGGPAITSVTILSGQSSASFYYGDSHAGSPKITAASLSSPTQTESISKASPTLSATGPSSGTAGTAIAGSSIGSALAGASGSNATGTITFYESGPSSSAPTTCTGAAWTSVGTASVSGTGSYTSSGGFTPPSAGNYWLYNSYNGDANNNSATSHCPSVTEIVVGKASPTLTATGPSTGTIGTTITKSSISSVLAGGSSATGTITFTVFGPESSAPASCSTGGTTVGTATVSGNGTYNSSAAYTPTAAGNYWWYASYGGDGSNNSAVSTCGSGMSETVVSKASPTITATGPASGTAGANIAKSSISSVLAGGSAPSGTITVTVFGPQSSAPTSCITGGTTVGTATASGDGTYNPSAGYTPAAAGNYWWYASYGGDTNNNSAASTCGSGMSETVVGKASPTVTATGPASGTAGTAIASSSISSVLAGGSGPTGTITVKVFGPQSSAPTSCTAGTTVGTATASGDGSYNPSAGYTPATAGDYWWYASYGGDGSNNSAASTCGSGMSETVVGKASPTVTATGPGIGTVNSTIAASSISSVLAGGSGPTGTITVTVFGPQSSAPTTCTTGGTTVGTATVTGNGTYNPSAGYKPTATGNYWWYASYGGDSNNKSAVSTCGSGMSETVVGKASPTITATGPPTGSAGTAIPSSSISSVLASGVSPTGTITFYVFGPQSSAPTSCTTGGTTVGTASVSGNTTYHSSAGYTPNAAGNYWWYASYGGDGSNNAATSTCGSGMSETVVSGSVATKLVITTLPVSGSASNSATLGPIVCQLESATNSPVNAATNTTVTLSSTSAGGIFAALSGGASTTTVTINAGSSSTSFYYGDTVAGSPTITAKSGSLTQANQIETINAGTANSITIVSGSPQSAQVAMAFGSPLVVQVSDTWGNPVGGASVTFLAPASGASGTFANSTDTTSASTGSNGQASSTTFTANTTAGGPYNVSASTSGPAPVNFHMTNNPGPASKLVFTTEPSTNQNIAAGSSIAVQVAVADTYGNPESADNTTTVTIGIGTNPTSGTLTCAGGDTATVSAGIATFSCSINRVGNGYTLSATSSPSHGTVVSNGFNIVAGPPASITVVSGSNQSTTQGTAFANPLVAMVTDAENNPVPGASVTFTAPSSGASGTFSNSSNTIIGSTGSNGQVSEVLTGNHTGAVYYSVTASVVPVSSPATFIDLLNGGNFTVNGPASVPPLLPGKSEPLDVVITNPNPESITIGADAITGDVTSILNGDANGSLAACSISWFSISPGPGGTSITIPAGATESLSDLSVAQADWPVLTMTDVATNQDNCSGATLNLGFAGTASGS